MSSPLKGNKMNGRWDPERVSERRTIVREAMQLIGKLFGTIVLVVGLTGCFTKMPLRSDEPVGLAPTQSLAVFKMTLKNEFKNYRLTPDMISLEAIEASGGKTYHFAFTTPERQISDREVEMLGSFALPPGDYQISKFTGKTDLGFAILPVLGKFDPTFERGFSIGTNDSVYLGHIMARLVERKSEDEERAGPIIPVLDQAATGMSNGTFKFEVVDDFQKDIEYIKVRYPTVANRSFRRALLTTGQVESPSVQVVPASVSSKTAQPTQVAPAKYVTAPASTETSSDNCSVTQILEMKKLGLSDSQIKKSCASAR